MGTVISFEKQSDTSSSLDLYIHNWIHESVWYHVNIQWTNLVKFNLNP